MWCLGPILLTDKIPPSVPRSCDISILHKQIHGLCEMTGSGQTSMIWQTRLATTELFRVRLLCSVTSKRHLCAVETAWSMHVDTLKRTSLTCCLLQGRVATVPIYVYPATEFIRFGDSPPHYRYSSAQIFIS